MKGFNLSFKRRGAAECLAASDVSSINFSNDDSTIVATETSIKLAESSNYSARSATLKSNKSVTFNSNITKIQVFGVESGANLQIGQPLPFSVSVQRPQDSHNRSLDKSLSLADIENEGNAKSNNFEVVVVFQSLFLPFPAFFYFIFYNRGKFKRFTS